MISLLEAEQAFVGSCLFEKKTAVYALDLLDPTQITYEPFKSIYGAVQALIDEGKDPTDNSILLDHMDKAGMMVGDVDKVGVSMAYSVYTTIDNLPSYADIIKTESTRKIVTDLLRDGLSRINTESPAEILGDIRSEISGYESVHAPVKALSLKEIADIAYKEAEEKGAILSTGIKELDSMQDGGVSPTSFTIIGAAPSIGKSALAANILLTANIEGRPARGLYISMEMGNSEVFDRLTAIEAGIKIRAAKSLRLGYAIDKYGKKCADTFSRIQQKVGAQHSRGVNSITQMEHKIVATGLVSAADVRALVSAHQNDVDFIVLDYIQQVKPGKGQSDFEKVNEMSWTAKDIAMKYKKPFFALSQFNREGYKDGKKPSMADLRQSGQLEQDADNIWLLWRQRADDVIKEELEVKHCKNRSGQTGTSVLTFELDKCRIF